LTFSDLVEEKSSDDLIDQLILALPTAFRKRSELLNWLSIDMPYLSNEELEMITKFPLPLYDSVFEAVRMHISDPQKAFRFTG
jgi:hypothetical protein